MNDFEEKFEEKIINFNLQFSEIYRINPYDGFTIDENITVQLVDNLTEIFVNDIRFISCKKLLFNPYKYSFKHVESIDEIIFSKDSELKLYELDPVEEFWGHVSNLQAWVENDYDTRILGSNLSFPLLKKLTEVGNKKAKVVFKNEIIKRLKSGYRPTITYLINENYHNFLDDIDIMEIIRFLERNIQATNELDYLKYVSYFYEYLGKMDKVIEISLLILEKENNEVNKLQYTAKIYKHLGKFHKAISLYKKAIEINPKLGNIWFCLGQIYYRLGRNEDALKSFKESLNLKTYSRFTLEKLGIIYNDLGNYKKAIQYFKYVIEIDPSYAYGYLNLAVTLSNQDQELEASQAFQKATNLKNSLVLWTPIIFKDRNLKNFFEEISTSGEYNGINYTELGRSGWYNLGISFYRNRAFDFSLICVNFALQIDRYYLEALKLKADINFKLKKYRKAIKFYKQVLGLNNSIEKVLLRIGISYSKINNYSEAMFYFKNLKDKGFRNSKAKYLLADIKILSSLAYRGD